MDANPHQFAETTRMPHAVQATPRRAALAALVALAAVARGADAQRAEPPTDVAVERLLDEGYARQRRNDAGGAIERFRLAAERDSARHARPLLDLAYALLAAGRRAEAVPPLQAAVRLDPANAEAQLQLGYLYAGAGDAPRARDAFGAVLGGPESARAEHGLAGLTQGGDLERGALFTEVYAAPVYQTRFSNLIAPVVVRSGVAALERPRAALYASARLTRDTRSVGGVQPQVFSDNVAIPALGVRVQPVRRGPTLYSEVGAARPLLATPDARTRADFRGGGYYSAQWGGAAPSRAPRLVGDLYADASYYSRFDDAIAYLQLREAVRVREWGGGWAELYGRASAVGDTRREFYNNVGEVGAGLRVLPWRTAGASLSAEYVRGAYWVRSTAANAAPYGELRATVIVSKVVTNRLGVRGW